MKIRLEKELETFQLTLKKQIEHHAPIKQTVLFVCLLSFFFFFCSSKDTGSERESKMGRLRERDAK